MVKKKAGRPPKKPSERRQSVSISMPIEFYKALEALAFEKGTTISAFIRSVIERRMKSRQS